MQYNLLESPIEKFKELYKLQAQKKEHLHLEPQILSLIYEELQKQNILLTSFIGQGREGIVFEAKKGDEYIAVKCISKPVLEDIKREEELIQSIREIPQVAQFIEGFFLFDGTKYFQISKKYQCDMKNVLIKLFEQKQTFPLNSIIAFALQMSTCFEALKSKKVVHSDIKPQNILYDGVTKQFKLGDFGMSLKIKNLENSYTQSWNGGNFKYIAPEINSQSIKNSIKGDVFGLGLLLLELTRGKFLETEDTFKIKQGKLKQYLNLDGLYSDLNQIIQLMLNIDREKRLDPASLTKLLMNLKEKYQQDFKIAVEGKVSKKYSQAMIEQYNRSFIEIECDFDVNHFRFDSYECDYKQFKEISSITKKRLIRHLQVNAENNNIGPGGSKNIILSLEQCQILTSLNLNLTGNNIGAEGVKNVGLSLEKCPNLVSLNLNIMANNIGAEGAKYLGGSLEKCQNITSLDLNMWVNNLGAEGAKNIGLSLEKCQNIISLNLNLMLNNLGALGAKHIGISLEKCVNITSLGLNLEINKLGSEGAKNIGQSLEKCQSLTALNLNLVNNKLSNEGVMNIVMSLEKCLKLSSLNLNLKGNNLSKEDAQNIRQILKRWHGLSTLELNLE